MISLDARIFYAIYAAGNGAFTGIALLLSAIGGGWAMLGLIPLFGMPRWRRFALSLTAALTVTAILVFAIKFAVGRPRPCVSLSGVSALCSLPTDPSFPSGHACGSFTVLAFILLVLHSGEGVPMRAASRALLSLALVLLAFGIGWSRIYLGVHFPSDVAAGAVLGVAWGAVAGRLYVRGFAKPHA